MQQDVLLSTQRDAVLVLTLNRPAKLNALNRHLISELMRALDAAETDGSIRALVVTGAGRAFSAGADIAEFSTSVAAGPEHAARDFVRPGQDLCRRLESYRKPIIAAVNGLAFGGGCEITEAMHLAVAAQGATFSKAEIDIGIIPVFGGTQRLPRQVGRKAALEMILTGRPIDANRALVLGLVNKVVPPDLLLAEAMSLAAQVASRPAAAVAAALHAVHRGLNVGIDEGLLIEAAAFEQIVGSAEALKGVSRFLGRRNRSARTEPIGRG
ncbi:MAG: enoyl-CoA hydratase-related protein [Allosphingosinicella sp.]|uniref:enoyl-CoA hydratase-related protein n=1 Tax=Allosphingosinicella sp. TaxID=2823234 RepID=UPI003922DDBB